MRVIVRFNTPDENGETRRERNARFFREDLNRDPEIPPWAEYLIDWFFSISSLRPDGFNGPGALLPSLVEEWSFVTGNIVTRDEMLTILAMDAEYRAALSREHDEQRKRAEKKNG